MHGRSSTDGARGQQSSSSGGKSRRHKHRHRLGISGFFASVLIFHCGYHQEVVLTAGQHYEEKQAAGRFCPETWLNNKEVLYMPSHCLCQQKGRAELRLLYFHISKSPHCLKSPFTPRMSPPRQDGSVGGSDEPYTKGPLTPLPPAVGRVLRDRL